MSEKYSQPDFYRFNEDSIKLVKWLQARELVVHSILDLGAGSGVIGIELARTLEPQHLTLVELQAEFRPHLESNCQDFLPKAIKASILITSFFDFKPEQKFDLIVCNPPYYLPGKGELSKDPNRALARSFLIDSWNILLLKISGALSIHGNGFIVLKQDISLFKSISTDALKLDLVVEKHNVGSIMILKLFRLNKN